MTVRDDARTGLISGGGTFGGVNDECFFRKLSPQEKNWKEISGRNLLQPKVKNWVAPGHQYSSQIERAIAEGIAVGQHSVMTGSGRPLLDKNSPLDKVGSTGTWRSNLNGTDLSINANSVLLGTSIMQGVCTEHREDFNTNTSHMEKSILQKSVISKDRSVSRGRTQKAQGNVKQLGQILEGYHRQTSPFELAEQYPPTREEDSPPQFMVNGKRCFGGAHANGSFSYLEHARLLPSILLHEKKLPSKSSSKLAEKKMANAQFFTKIEEAKEEVDGSKSQPDHVKE